MLKSDPQLIRYPPACRSVKFATRTQHWAFRLRYAAGVAMAFVLSSLAPAMLIALIWHETGLAAMMFALTFLIALSHAILLGLPLFLICQFRGWVSLASCVALGAFIGIVPAAILAHPAQLSEFSARAWASGVLTASDGAITTAAVWVGYIRSVIYFALFGAWGGFIFWTVLKCWGMFNGGRQNLPGNFNSVSALIRDGKKK